MTLVVLITNWMRKVRAVTSMSVGMFLMPLSALLMASSSILTSITGESVSIFGIFNAHPVTVMMIAGIVVQGLAECFISPRYLEYFSLQAPKGEEGLYLGFSHLHSFLSSLLGFGISGYLLSAYAPDPAGLTAEQLVHAYDHAHYIWYYFAGIGFTAAVALLIYRSVFNRKDK
jgi:dipeptide/tripeptide permease